MRPQMDIKHTCGGTTYLNQACSPRLPRPMLDACPRAPAAFCSLTLHLKFHACAEDYLPLSLGSVELRTDNQ